MLTCETEAKHRTVRTDSYEQSFKFFNKMHILYRPSRGL